MNVHLLKSRWLGVGAVTASLLLAWAVRDLGADLLTGRVSRSLRLVSGALALVGMLGAWCYVLRKYAHKVGYSPEFKLRTKYQAIERATRSLQRLEFDLRAEPALALSAAKARVNRVVRDSGAGRVLRGRVVKEGSNPIRIEIVPTEPLGRMEGWLGFHLGMGLLFAVATLVHAGWSSRSGLGQALIVASVLVVLSGLFGLYAWLVGPERLTRAEEHLSSEEAFSLGHVYERKVREARESGAPARDLAVLEEQRALVQAQHVKLRRLYMQMRLWKVVHVPVAVVLVGLVALHLHAIFRF